MHILKLIIKNTLRHKLRSMLTIVGIAIAVISFSLLQTVVTAWHAGVESSGADRLVSRHAVSFIFPLPLSYEEKIQHVNGVTSVCFANWFGGTYIDKNQFFARLAVSDNYLEIYPEFVVPKDQLDTYQRERNSCIIGSQIAERYHMKLGDIVPMDGDIYPGRWEFVVRGIYTPKDKTTDPSNFFFHWSYIDERMKQESPGRAGYVGWYIIKTRDINENATVSKAVDEIFANSPAETKTETERAFQQSFLAQAGAILTAMNLISFVIIGIIMLVLGNTMIMAARERRREYAVFKTLGFSAYHLTGLIAGESLAIAGTGSLIGILLSFPATDAFAVMMPKGWFPIFNLEVSTLLLAGLAAISVGAAAAVFPLQRALRTTIVDGLRQIG
jgi:putative ABC transport system permease protein